MKMLAGGLALWLTVSSGVALPGDVAWTFPTGGNVTTSPALSSDGIVYFGSTDNNIYAVNTATGMLKWKYLTGGDLRYAVTVGWDGVVYAGSSDGYLYALEGATGALRWRRYIAASATGIAIGAAGMLYVVDDKGFVQSLDPMTSQSRWMIYLGGGARTVPAIGTNGVLYVGSDYNRLHALSADTGALLWEFATSGNVSSPAIGADGTVYFGSGDNKLYAVDGATGARKWAVQANADVHSPVIARNGTVYVGSSDNYLYAVNAATGALIRKVDTMWDITAAPAVGRDGTVYVPTGGFLQAFNSDLSTSLWSAYLAYSYSANVSSVAIAPNGMLYVGSLDNNLCAVMGNSPTGADLGPWPMLGQNPQHCGRGWTAPFVIRMKRMSATRAQVIVEGSAGMAYQLQQTTQIGNPGAWTPAVTLTNTFGSLSMTTNNLYTYPQMMFRAEALPK